jgi:hypothetical protein
MKVDALSHDAPYVYQSLDSAKSEIRLIHVQRHTSGVIKCNLTTVSLTGPPDHVCLSYTWGPHTQLRRVRLDDGFLNERENLHHFLEENCHN